MSETPFADYPTLSDTTQIVSAYLSNHHLPPGDVPGLIAAVHGALSGLAAGNGGADAQYQPEPLTHAQIRKSITPDALISFVDGKPYKTLKRHLTKHGLTMDSYRAKYGLPADYPSICLNYSAKRSELAKGMRLGNYRARQAAE